MAMTTQGVLLYSRAALKRALMKLPEKYQDPYSDSLLTEEALHRVHDVVEPGNASTNRMRLMRLPQTVRELVKEGYPSAQGDEARWGKEYIRMLAQVRAGLPLK